jgi:Rrf2 family protein
MAGLLRITEAFGLAFHSLAYLMASPKDRPVSAGELAGIFDVSETHLGKVLQRLARQGLLSSKRGPKGGFFLNENTEGASLLDIHEAVDGPLDPKASLLTQHLCKPGACVMEKLLQSVYEMVRGRMDETNLADMVSKVKLKNLIGNK